MQTDKLASGGSQLAGYTQLLQALAVEGVQAAFNLDGSRDGVRMLSEVSASHQRSEACFSVAASRLILCCNRQPARGMSLPAEPQAGASTGQP